MMKIAHSFALFALVLSLFTGCNNKSANTIAYIDFSDFWDYSATNSNQMVQMWDQLHTTATLQGVVNRHSPKIYINYVKNEMMEADRFWWNYYRQEGRWLADRDTITYSNVVSLVEAFSDKIDGAVVYDSNIPSTSCVASAVAGVENLVAVRYDTSKGSLYDQIIVNGPKLEVKVWLVNSDGTSLFTGKGTIPQTSRESSGSLKNDPYIWFIENYMKKDKCSGEYGAYYLDQYWRQNPSAAPMNAHCLTNHDFFVSRKAFFFDLSPWADEAATDDPTQKIGTDFNTLIEMLKEAYRLNKGEKMCHIGGFPAWAYKYTQHAEGSHQDVATEWEFSRIISAYNAFKDADAIGYGAMANASFWQHFPTKQSYPQKWVTTEELTERGYLDANGKVNFNGRKFMIFYVGDYDASSWITSVLPHLWSDKVRGSLPLMWCVSPILERRAPMVLDYLRATASENDYFAAADNGAGYLMPGMLQEPRELSALPDGLEAWANHCRPFYEKWGLTISGFVIDGHAPALTDKGLECYASFSPNGIVPQKTPRTRLFGNMPILRSGWDLVQGPEQSAALIVDDIHKSPIPFAWYRDILKSPSWHKQIMDKIAKLDPNIELLDAPTFFELYRRWLKENPDAAAGKIE